MNTWLVFSYIYCPHGSGFFKVLVSCYSWEVMRGKMLQRDTLVHGGILEPVHYMHYIFFLQAHLNRIYQVWNLHGTEMYRSSVAKYASRFDKTLDWNQIIPFFYWKFPSCFLKTPRNDLIRSHEIDSTVACFPNTADKLHWSCDGKRVELISRDQMNNLVNNAIKGKRHFCVAVAWSFQTFHHSMRLPEFKPSSVCLPSP